MIQGLLSVKIILAMMEVKILQWKSKSFSSKTLTSTTTTNNSLNRKLNYFDIPTF